MKNPKSLNKRQFRRLAVPLLLKVIVLRILAQTVLTLLVTLASVRATARILRSDTIAALIQGLTQRLPRFAVPWATGKSVAPLLAVFPLGFLTENAHDVIKAFYLLRGAEEEEMRRRRDASDDDDEDDEDET